MKLILPLDMKGAASSFKFPLTLFLFGKKGVIKLSKFTISEKESVFGISDLKLTKNGAQYKLSTAGISPTLHQHSKKLNYKFKIVIEDKTENPSALQKIQRDLDLVFKIVVGKELSFAKIESKKTGINNSILFSMNTWRSRRNIGTIDDKILLKVKKLLAIITKDSLPKKTKTLSFFFDTALQAPNLDIAGAFFITLLESLFVPDKDSEIAYRFSMRITKMRNSDLNYRKRIKQMYAYRSQVFHGNNGKFNTDDVKFVEEEAAWALEKYIANPSVFDSTVLDKNLLQV